MRSQIFSLNSVMVLLGLADGLLLGKGLELCFGIGQYRLIMLFGALGGFGVGLMAWIGAGAWERHRRAAWRTVVAGAAPAVLVFLAYFVWRIVPLIQEEIKYSL